VELMIDRSYLSQIENGKKIPSPQLLQRISILESCGPIGQQFGVTGPQSSVKESPTPYNAGMQVMKSVPVISWAHAGASAAYEPLPLTWQPRIPATCPDPEAFGLTIEGDSMEPRFSAGDIVVVTPRQEPRNGDLVIAKLKDDGVVFKIYQFSATQSRITLSSYNPAYPAQEYTPTDFHWIYPIHTLVRKIR
jgi:SOS-response transcriptional repressor LexA